MVPVTLAALAPLPIWVGWRREVRDGRTTKVPYCPRTDGRAASDNPATWTTHDEAASWVVKKRANGVGLMFCPVEDVSLAGIDLDTCRNKNTGDIAPWAQQIVDRLNTYSEVSPSGTGVKLFFTIAIADAAAIDELFDGKQGRSFKNGAGGDHPPAVEIYRGRRYFVVTNASIGPTDELRCVSPTDLQWLINEAGPKLAGEGKRSNGEDASRSANAFRAGAVLKAEGATYKEMCAALLVHEDADIAAWARTKGLNNDERELKRIYDKAGGELVTVGGVEKRLTTLDDLNERYALLHAPGSATVDISRPDFLPIQDVDLKRRLAGEVVRVSAPGGKVSFPSAFNYWTGHARRHLYRRVVFANQRPRRRIQSLSRPRRRAPRGLLRAHRRARKEVICSGNETNAEAMLKLLAWQIQNIGKPSRIIAVLKSEKQQAGKGIFSAKSCSKSTGLRDLPLVRWIRFSAVQRRHPGRSYIFLDEVLFAGDRKSADALKSLSTTDLYGIETKGLPVVQCPVGVNLWLASNHKNAA